MLKPGIERRKRVTAGLSLAVVAAMLGLAFASVPLYRLVCQAIGIGGTTRVATSAPEFVSDVAFTVRFDANTDKQLPWEFKPNQKSVVLKAGEVQTISYHARNLSDHVTVGSATYNVTPEKAGPFFDKLQCFCFQEQILGAGQEADFAVRFFVDPAILKDKTATDVREITLSYTFFRSKNGIPIENEDAALHPTTKGSMAPVSGAPKAN